MTVERAGNLHLAPQRPFAQAGSRTRVVHAFAVMQFRLPAVLVRLRAGGANRVQSDSGELVAG